jgi:hypothetical protein
VLSAHGAGGSLDIDNDLTMRTVVVLIIAAIHAVYFAFVVTKEGIKEAFRKYGRELILCTEALTGPFRASPALKKAT